MDGEKILDPVLINLMVVHLLVFTSGFSNAHAFWHSVPSFIPRFLFLLSYQHVNKQDGVKEDHPLVLICISEFVNEILYI